MRRRDASELDTMKCERVSAFTIGISKRTIVAIVWLMTATFASTESDAEDSKHRAFVLKFVDEATGRPVPLVEAFTVHGVTHVSDNDGVTAWTEPELQGEEVHFLIRSHGYEAKADGFGFRGVRTRVVAGETVVSKLQRLQIAQRLYRITGAGRLAESQAAGLVSNNDPRAITRAKVVGQDSVQMTRYKGELHWLWGDTSRLSYPLGNFHVPSARTSLPGMNSWNPDQDIPLRYFEDSKTGLAAETCRMSGDGPTWAGALAAVRDDENRELLVCWYAKIKPPLETYRRGVAVWNDTSNRFENLKEFGPEPVGPPDGAHELIRNEDGVDWLYFSDPFPFCRVRAKLADYSDPAAYERWTCETAESTPALPKVEHDDAGQPVFRWRRSGIPFDQKRQKELVSKGLLRDSDCPIRFRTSDSKEMQVSRGSIARNHFRKKWIMIFGQMFAKESMVGEIWYAEADELTGPWEHAVKVVTHDKYSFYNPVHHPELDSLDGRMIRFEGTYTTIFSGVERPTPRYDYNQILYELDLSDPRLRSNPK
jgi:hypothetical protein